MGKRRNRIVYLLLIISTIGMGLLSRASFIPELIYPYLGDILYTVMFYFIFAFLFPEMPAHKVAFLSIAFCFAIEFLQFYQADWINQIRANKLGGLILGFGFRWSDLVCYALGGLLALGVERFFALYREE